MSRAHWGQRKHTAVHDQAQEERNTALLFKVPVLLLTNRRVLLLKVCHDSLMTEELEQNVLQRATRKDESLTVSY